MSKKDPTNLQLIIDLIRGIAGQANVLTIPRLFIDLTGDIKSALFLSQCIYWSDRSSVGDGWFYKSYAEWKLETGLSFDEIKRIKKDLANRHFINFDIRDLPDGNNNQQFFRANLEKITQQILQDIPSVEKQDIPSVEKQQTPSVEKQQTPLLKNNRPLSRKTTDPLLKNNRAIKGITEPTHNLLPETTSETSSSYPLQENQEEDGPQEMPDELITLLRDLGVFETLWHELLFTDWDTEELIELGYKVKNGNYDNPGAIYMWRVRNHKPPRLKYTHKYPADAPERIEDELELIPDKVISAWEMTMDRIKGEINQVDFNNWIGCGSIQIKNYNGSLILWAANNQVLSKLNSLNLTDEVLSDYVSGYLGQRVPVQFVMS